MKNARKEEEGPNVDWIGTGGRENKKQLPPKKALNPNLYAMTQTHDDHYQPRTCCVSSLTIHSFQLWSLWLKKIVWTIRSFL